MSTTDGGSDVRSVARERVQKRRDFTGHLVAYVVVNAMLVGIWAIGGRGYFWPAWVLLGWGIGVILNAWDVYFRRPITDADIDREVRNLEAGH
jgi:hypothetical protein